MNRKGMMKRLTGLIALLIGVTVSMRAEVSLFMSDCAVERGDTAEIRLYVSDAAQESAFQTDVTLPSGVQFIGARLSACTSTHTLLAKERSRGVVRIGCWSASNALLTTTTEPIVTLTVVFPRTMLGGAYDVEADGSLIVYPNGGNRTIPRTIAKAWVSVAAEREGRAQLLSECPSAQAFAVRNVASSRYLTLSSGASKITIEVPCDGPDAQFFLEPAFDAGSDTYYLCNAAGYYLALSSSGNTVRTGITQSPSKTSAVRLVLTGERTYAVLHAQSGWPMGTASNAAGAVIDVKAAATSTDWKFLPAPAIWPAAVLLHMAEKASAYVGLTQGEADLQLRMAIHKVRRAATDNAETDVLSRITEALKGAVATAREAHQEGDTSVVALSWGTPEPIPADEYVVSTERADGTTAYLSMAEGRPVLADGISVCSIPVQDLFYNPYTDCYALRLRGDGEDGAGTYLACNSTDGSLTEADRSAGEALRVWKVQTLTEVLQSITQRSGNCGPNAKWHFEPETKTLFITGTERTAYYNSPEDTPWSAYRHLIQKAVLAGDFTMMGTYLLAGCTSLRKLTLTAKSAPSYTKGTFDGVPEGLEVSVFNTEAYTDFLPGCRVTPVAQVRDTYVYSGNPLKLEVVCDFDATVSASNLKNVPGTYTTTASLQVYIEGTGYAFSLPVTYTVEPAPLTFTTKAYSRTYGAKNPKLRVTVEGLIGSDQESSVVAEMPVASCEADNLSVVGVYPITLTGGALKNANYMLVLQNSTLTVSPARLTVQAADATREQGQPNPPFTYAFRGWVNGEDESVVTEWPVLVTDADETSLPGLYDIVPVGGAAPNYELRPVTGILTITAPVQVDGMAPEEAPSLIYDLMGRRIAQPTEKGIYIQNGKKFMIK